MKPPPGIAPAWWAKLRFRHPSQVVVSGFSLAIFVGTLLLRLPIATHHADATPWHTAFFTATSATCITGLSTVDIGSHYTVFGHVVILTLVQIGGFGVVMLASMVGLFIAHRLGLKSRLNTAAEARQNGIGDLRRLVVGVVRVTLIIELTAFVLLSLRWYFGYGMPLRRALYYGAFHAISATNNAGFALFPDSLVPFRTDPLVLGPLAAAVVINGLGVPVIMEVVRVRRVNRWSLHTKLTLTMTVVLLVGGALLLTALEWTNPHTLGPLSVPEKFVVGSFHSVAPRSSGFAAWDYAATDDGTKLSTVVLMFIGGGSASTAGGIKVTTFVLLLVAILAEVRGEDEASAFGRSISSRTIRQALAVALVGVAVVVGSTLVLAAVTDFEFIDLLFEATSASATVGASTGITGHLPIGAQLFLCALMFLGRLGPITFVSALAARESRRRYHLPEGRPLIG